MTLSSSRERGIRLLSQRVETRAVAVKEGKVVTADDVDFG